MQTQNATEEITKKIEALQRDAAGSVDAVHRISQAIEAIRPVFENVNGAVAEQNATTGEMADNAASASSFIVSVGDSATEIDSATKEAEAHGESVAKAGTRRHDVCAEAQVALRRAAAAGRNEGDRQERRKGERLPCSLKIEIADPARGDIGAGLRNFHGGHSGQRGGRGSAGAGPELRRRRCRMSAPAGFASSSGRRPARTRSSKGRMRR